MQYTNSQILSAVLAKWSEPILPIIMNTTISSFSASLLPVEKFLKNWGLAQNNWSLANELQSLVAVGGSRTIQPIIYSMVSKIPDNIIPAIAHNYVDEAIKKGSLPVLDGHFQFDKDDLIELKKYLNCNLPYETSEEYAVKIPVNTANIDNKPELKPDSQSSGNKI